MNKSRIKLQNKNSWLSKQTNLYLTKFQYDIEPFKDKQISRWTWLPSGIAIYANIYWIPFIFKAVVTWNGDDNLHEELSVFYEDLQSG